jgi:hypothetical protein
VDDKPIIVIADTALFELGVSVGFGAVFGGFLAIIILNAFEFLWSRIFPPPLGWSKIIPLSVRRRRR